MALTMKNKILISVFLLTLFISENAFSKAYFSPDKIDVTLINPPIKTDSEQYKKEVEYIVDLQKKVTPEQIKVAEYEIVMRPEILLEKVDSKFTRASHPKLYQFLDDVYATSKAVTDKAKNFYNTKRPYIQEKQVKALINAHANPAYPSGHTSGSYTWSYVLSEIFPNKKEEFFKQADKIAQSRVIAGMHYPHDVEGGKQLAKLIFEQLKITQEFNKDLEVIKQEVK
jgi:acid phosphatase (class A)